MKPPSIRAAAVTENIHTSKIPIPPGQFKLIGGTAKGHPTQEEMDAAVRFYENLK